MSASPGAVARLEPLRGAAFLSPAVMSSSLPSPGP
jgi:hypothetical protein